ncbi:MULTISPECIES: ABC transporter ATP-binding protein [Limosilactobacillus]|uniref:ABC transporter, ATP-binding protein n=2 Tax=Limosilactobacillus vaginalis TaxID=1633 RepID=C2EVZ9_9LACO|nr:MULTISPECIES: ABC transporter ATP-binding protein [Limosilactobacillus]PEH04821.1 ABC transporter ATP-binding protein [Lactobacillus sp. UMNPBX5]EEJ39925.1 ABC transporter, ATP-binding protein [Limosilactobacillus vaginalis DSM 5837 = ATCC 49540]KRM46942.1 sulfate-transporting ATPase [Limosilactobacillus vaginalis DSM 5837 = ATCC 49540]MCI6853082.1 ABC transporter ATP-binding protein [Limosilactobacillus vaginalis]MCZ2465935.1 ABC transporter ATP-binding protein [Limosilactobacillus vaginal
MALEIKNLIGGYSRIPVLKGISFQVKPGELVGLIGLNGAGKSTTINHVIGLLRPFSGEITLNGINIQQDPVDYKKQIAYVPETPILYDELTLREHIELTIKAYSLNTEEAWIRARKLLKTFRLDNKLDWFPANFSKGMKQKVMICCALMTNAKLLIVDEPFYGLDPLAVHDLLELIEERKKAGTAVLMSTHVLDTAQRYCDRFVLLANGKVRARGTLDELRQKADKPDESLDDIYLSLARDDQNE